MLRFDIMRTAIYRSQKSGHIHDHQDTSWARTRMAPSLFIVGIVILTVSFTVVDVQALHRRGVWSPSSNDWFKVIARFAVQKSNIHHPRQTFGYFYGNLTTLTPSIHDKIKPLSSRSLSLSSVNNGSTQNIAQSPINPHHVPALHDPNTEATILSVDRQTFAKLNSIYERYQNNRSEGCKEIGLELSSIAYDEVCSPEPIRLDMMRDLPCPKNGYCAGGRTDQEDGKDHSSTVVEGYQFTFTISNQKEPNFWYLILMGCAPRNPTPLLQTNSAPLKSANQTIHSIHVTTTPPSQNRTSLKVVKSNVTTTPPTTSSINQTAFPINASCPVKYEETSSIRSVYEYDIWLVNGHPAETSFGYIDLDHQFSYEQQDTLLYVFLVLMYLTLCITQSYAYAKYRHRNMLVTLFTSSLGLHSLSLLFITLHKLVYAHDGQGFDTLFVIGSMIKIISLAILILFLLVIAKGWPITRPDMRQKPLLILAAIGYCIIEMALFISVKNSSDPIEEEIDEYQTVPGWLTLGYRTLLMFWFLIELKTTMIREEDQRKLKFYLHFGAGIMVWFVHLPLVTVIALQVSLMWRYKLITGITAAANFLAYACLLHAIWPTRLAYNSFLNRHSRFDADLSEELEYYHQDNQRSSGKKNRSSNLNFTSASATPSYFTYENHVHFDEDLGGHKA